MLEYTPLILYIISVFICIPGLVYYWALAFDGITSQEILLNVIVGFLPILNALCLFQMWDDNRALTKNKPDKKYFTNLGKK